MFDNVYAGRRVLVTGHTGFKGSWLSTWLLELGATVAGYSVDIPTHPSHFEAIRLKERLSHYQADVRDRLDLFRVFDDFRPEIVFHLAAQALVSRSYDDPIGTFEVNAFGTMNVLDCLRQRPDVRAAVFVTSDKCYRNAEWVWGYRETDHLGGDDPYSGSKACAELLCHSYYHSFFKHINGPCIATARAGNVIGGGDWAANRIVPDCVRAWSSGLAVAIRSPQATRPWQHVLEPLSGYLWLGANLWHRRTKIDGGAFNFGPDASVNQPVEKLIATIADYWPAATWRPQQLGPTEHKTEANLLKLSCDKALAELGWKATLSFGESVRLTAQWYRQFYASSETDHCDVSRQQIFEYCDLARSKGQIWSTE
jgi:CDP-glucose 4,6-dehydratase